MSGNVPPHNWEDRLRVMEDKDAVRDLITAIARGVDRFDTGLLCESIHPDAELWMGGDTPIRGDAFVEKLSAPDKPRPGRMHLVGNHRIEVAGDSARSETYVISCQDVEAGGERSTRFRAGRYLDRFRRDGGRWQLMERVLVDEWARSDALCDMPAQGTRLGQPAPGDLSYEWFDK